jgi:RHS repeat-associated protein
MKSFLIVGFPKGFTSAAWQIAHRATGLRRPQVSAGEVLNPARIRQSGRGWVREFLREHDPMSDGFFSRNPEFYPKARAVLDHFAEGGFCIKDVVQPFYIMQYLAEHPGRYNVLFCERPIEEVTNGSANHPRRTSITRPDNTAIDLNYGSSGSADDVLNRLKQLKSGSTVLVDYTYLGQGTPVIANYSSQPAVALTYLKQSGDSDLTGDRNPGDDYYGLDRFGRVQDQRWRKGTSDLERVQYGYDRASNRVWRQNLVGTTGQNEFYTYDGLYQIKSLARGTNFTVDSGQRTGISSPVWEEDWNYDPTGNWRGSSTAYLTKVSGSPTLDQNRSHNKANEITGITTASGTSWPSPAHDAAGNMLTAPRPLDLGNSFDFKWDAWNRPVEVKNSGGSVVAGYGYDGANRRITKVTGNDTRHYYYSDQWQVLEERLDSGSGPVLNRQFVWGIRSIDDLILRDRDTTGNGVLNERLYALHDAMSVTAVVNTSGTVQERYGYYGFGQPRYLDGTFGARGSSSFDWETLFDAYRYDTESGLYQVRFRYLHPGLGRWVSRDPIHQYAENNLLAYAVNNPTNLSDPTGEAVKVIVIVVAGCAVAAVLAYCVYQTTQDCPKQCGGADKVKKATKVEAGVKSKVVNITVPCGWECDCKK